MLASPLILPAQIDGFSSSGLTEGPRESICFGVRERLDLIPAIDQGFNLRPITARRSVPV